MRRDTTLFSYFSVAITTAVVLLCVSIATAKEASPIHIQADRMISGGKSQTVVFTGDVDAKQDDVRIRSDKMTVFYGAKERKNEKSADKKVAKEVQKLICEGNVEVSRAEWLGTSQKMIYLAKERQVLLTGDAKAWQDQNMVSGDKIIYYLDEGRSEVVGSTAATGTKKDGSSRVSVTILQN
ncbi:MAG: lipopolysaccharide transport periplasmic protein LptA [Deltaproteobacteria bacterium]|nr:MAG: lipopolysaccharide transport periplasmic protein LptA [Desulfobacterales bacterium]PIE72496.1 MAG: lipopolysaccharide transport periplasmic protein LptA [Deltaproteobacteria bacterium]